MGGSNINEQDSKEEEDNSDKEESEPAYSNDFQEKIDRLVPLLVVKS